MSVAREDSGRGQRRHVHHGAGAVGNVDGVDQAPEGVHAGQHGARVGGVGRRGLRGHDEAAG